MACFVRDSCSLGARRRCACLCLLLIGVVELQDLHAHLGGLSHTCLGHRWPLQRSSGWLPPVAAQQKPADYIVSFLESSRAKDMFHSEPSCQSLEQVLDYYFVANSTVSVSGNGIAGRCILVHGLQSHLALTVEAGIALKCAALVVNSDGADQLVSDGISWTRSAQLLARQLLVPCDGAASSIGGWGQPYGEERRLLLRVAGAELVVGPVTNATTSPQPPPSSSGAPISARIESLLNVNVSLANDTTDSGVLRGRPVIQLNGTFWSICGDGFGDTHAAAVCRTLGYTGGGLAFSDAPFGFDPKQPALAGLNCSAGQGPEGCFAYLLAESACTPQMSVGIVCYPAFNEEWYCAAVANATSSFPPSGDCGQLLAAGAAVSAVLGNKFSGQPIPYPEATSLPCFRSYVAPLLFNWLDAWQDAVRRGSCTLLPFVWMEELRQQAASNCPAALATWHSEQGSLEEPRYMASNSTSWIHSECGRCEWPSCELQALWSPEAAYGGSWGANSSETALDVAQVASNSMDLPRRLANRTLIAGVLNRFSRRWGSDYQSDNSRSMSAAAPADPLASLALLPACFYTYTARSGLKLLDVIEDASSHFAFVALGQRALLPDDVLAQCMEGKGRYRYAVSVVELRDRADQPSAAVETVSGLLGAFEDPITMRDNIPTPRLPVVNLRMLALAGNMLTGTIPAITVPVLYVDLSNNVLDGSFIASLAALPPDAFSTTLVLDLSRNRLSGPLPPAGPNGPHAWQNLLATAVRIDLSGNALIGPLPPSWHTLLDEVDVVVHSNTGLRGRVPEEWLERMQGTPLKVQLGQGAGDDAWRLIVDRVARRHMDFNQVVYVKKKTIGDMVINTQDKLGEEDVMSICAAIRDVHEYHRWWQESSGTRMYRVWPLQLDDVQIHENYKQWQADPLLWCYGGWRARGELAAKVWVPALVIVVLAVVLPLPLHHLRLRIIARTRDHAAMVAAAMPQQEQLKGMEEACGEGEGGARRQSCGGATWAYAERAWTWLAPVLEVVEPRLCVIIYWTDIVSDFVFVTNYKGWSRQPAPAITVLLIILGNMTLLWILRIVSHRNDLGRAGWSRATCVLVGLATAPLGIAFELVWNAFLAVVTFVTIVPACRNGCSGVNAHSDVLSSITGNWHPLLKYDSNARIFEMSVLMEPLTESLPQAIVQTTCYIVGRQAGIEMLTEIYLFSSALSAISICKSMLVIAWRVFWAGSWKDVMCVRDVERGTFVRNESSAPAQGGAGGAPDVDQPSPPPPSTVALVSGPFVPPAPEPQPPSHPQASSQPLKHCRRPSADGASRSAGSTNGVLMRLSAQRLDQVDSQNPVYGRYGAAYGSQPPPPPPLAQ